MDIRSRAPWSIYLSLLLSACSTSEAPPTERVQVDPTAISTQGATQVTATDTGAGSPAALPTAERYSGTALTYTVIDAPNGTFGYDILSDGKLFIHQTNLPGQPGNEGCKTKADAERLAEFVVKKVQGGEMPPSITGDELKALGIIK